ncbi:MAG: trimeric intracellular cation channel family protein [Chitinophagaceae bacterium]
MSNSYLHVIDIVGTAAFAISGTFSAMEKKLDPFGVIILAFVTAIGGGTLRDVLIGDLPVAWLRNETAIIVIISATLLTLFFGSYVRRFPTILFLSDAAGLGLFTIVGIEKGVQLDFSPGICIALGTITGCFGGVIRDVLLNNVPLVFHKEIYASACIMGGAIFFLLQHTMLPPDVNTFLCIAIIFIIRIIAVRYHLALPKFYLKNNKQEP